MSKGGMQVITAAVQSREPKGLDCMFDGLAEVKEKIAQLEAAAVSRRSERSGTRD